MLSNRHALPAVDAAPIEDFAAVVRRLTSELRNPLSAIEQIGFCVELALPIADTRSRKKLRELQRQVRRARGMLADAEFCFDPDSARFSEVDLKEIVSRVLSEWHPGDSGWVCLHLEDDLPPLRLDVAMMERLLRTLMLLLPGDAEARIATMVRLFAAEAAVVLEIASPSGAVFESLLEPPADPLTENGLALASARRILEVHGASVELRHPAADRVSLRIAFPSGGA
jgi:signal transduction histidine kinase